MVLKKTLIIVGAGTLVVGALALWGPLSSYVRTTTRLASQSAHDMVPTNFEIERIETLVRDLDATVAQQRSRVVSQEVDLEYLENEVERALERVESLEHEVRSARDMLSIDRPSYVIAGIEYDRGHVVAEANAKAQSLQRARGLAEAKVETSAALRSALDEANRQIRGASRTREEYTMRLAQLRASAENAAMRQELATVIGDLPGGIDGGAFQEVEEAFTRVERELAVQHRLLDETSDQGIRPGSIDFAASEDKTDILAVLDSALGEETPEPVAHVSGL